MNNKDEIDEETMSFFMVMFESGRELEEMYRKYNGNLDWSEWLRKNLPKTDLKQAILTLKKKWEDEARIDEHKQFWDIVPIETEHVETVKDISRLRTIKLINGDK